MVELFSQRLVKENQKQELLVRGDYMELCEFALVLLGCELPGGRRLSGRS